MHLNTGPNGLVATVVGTDDGRTTSRVVGLEDALVVVAFVVALAVVADALGGFLLRQLLIEADKCLLQGSTDLRALRKLVLEREPPFSKQS